jgi:hypothetical protein
MLLSWCLGGVSEAVPGRATSERRHKLRVGSRRGPKLRRQLPVLASLDGFKDGLADWAPAAEWGVAIGTILLALATSRLAKRAKEEAEAVSKEAVTQATAADGASAVADGSDAGLYNRSFRAYALAKGLDLAQQARLLAKFALSGADTFITCLGDKAHWSFWRPMTAIRLGDEDRNANTEGDPNWTSAIANPPYPDHSSGYNCTTGSYMKIAELYFGRGLTTFTLLHPTGMTREYEHFRNVWQDTIEARILQGIHFRSADEQGAKIGRHVARWVDKHALQSATE